MELHVSILGVHGALASSLRLQVRREQDLVLDSHGRATFYVRFLLVASCAREGEEDSDTHNPSVCVGGHGWSPAVAAHAPADGGGGGVGGGGHRVVPKAHLCVRLRDGCCVLGRAVVPLASLAVGILPPDQVTDPLVLCSVVLLLYLLTYFTAAGPGHGPLSALISSFITVFTYLLF